MFPFLFLTISLLLPFIVKAYKIDASCEEKGIAADVRAAMGSAIQMVNAAYTTLAKPSVLLSDDEVELIRNLFAKDGLEPAQLIDDGKMDKTNRLLYSIQHNMGQEVTGSNSVPDTDVVGQLSHAYSIVDDADVPISDHLLPLRPLGTGGGEGESL